MHRHRHTRLPCGDDGEARERLKVDAQRGGAADDVIHLQRGCRVARAGDRESTRIACGFIRRRIAGRDRDGIDVIIRDLRCRHGGAANPVAGASGERHAQVFQSLDRRVLQRGDCEALRGHTIGHRDRRARAREVRACRREARAAAVGEVHRQLARERTEAAQFKLSRVRTVAFRRIGVRGEKRDRGLSRFIVRDRRGRRLRRADHDATRRHDAEREEFRPLGGGVIHHRGRDI